MVLSLRGFSFMGAGARLHLRVPRHGNGALLASMVFGAPYGFYSESDSLIAEIQGQRSIQKLLRQTRS